MSKSDLQFYTYVNCVFLFAAGILTWAALDVGLATTHGQAALAGAIISALATIDTSLTGAVGKLKAKQE